MIVTAVVFTIIVLAREYTIALERREWASERQLLLERIQRPEVTPVVSDRVFEIPEVEPDEFDMIGSIREAHVADAA